MDPLTIVLTSTMALDYREAALRWEAVADLRQQKIEYHIKMRERCEETSDVLREAAKRVTIEERTPDWVWPTAAGGIVVAFILGVAAS